MLTGDDGTGDHRAGAERRDPALAQPARAADARRRSPRSRVAGIERGASIVHNHNDEPMFTTDGVHAVEPYLAAWATGARRGTPTRCSTRRWPPARAASRCGTAGRTSRSWPGEVWRDDAGRSRLGQRRADQRRERAGTGRGRAVPELLRRRRAHVRPQRRARAAPSISVFEPGFLRTALTLASRRPGSARARWSSCTSAATLEFGLPPTATALDAYLELLEPSGLPWSVAVLGGDVVACGLAERAIARGGHVRVGLEDYAGPASRATPICSERRSRSSSGSAGPRPPSRRPGASWASLTASASVPAWTTRLSSRSSSPLLRTGCRRRQWSRRPRPPAGCGTRSSRSPCTRCGRSRSTPRWPGSGWTSSSPPT